MHIYFNEILSTVFLLTETFEVKASQIGLQPRRFVLLFKKTITSFSSLVFTHIQIDILLLNSSIN